jgi:hypothetical protein
MELNQKDHDFAKYYIDLTLFSCNLMVFNGLLTPVSSLENDTLFRISVFHFTGFFMHNHTYRYSAGLKGCATGSRQSHQAGKFPYTQTPQAKKP